MIDLIARLISGDGLTTVLIAVGLYIGFLWLLFSFWVFIDAKRRYKKRSVAIVFFLVVLIFNFPALVFYLITRPEDEGEFVVLPADQLHNRGVNIPIVNFIGKDGKVHFGFEMKIYTPELLESNPDMSIDINWNSNKAEFQKVEPEVVKVENVTVKEDAKKDNRVEKVKENINNVKSKAKKSFQSARTKVGSIKPKFSFPKKTTKDRKD